MKYQPECRSGTSHALRAPEVWGEKFSGRSGEAFVFSFFVFLPGSRVIIISQTEGRGERYFMSEKDRKLEELREAAAQGDIHAQSALGTFLVSENGDPSGCEEGMKWLLTAAQGGDVAAMFNLGIVFEKGIGTRKNPDEAVLWFWQAAERGDEGARLKLGIMFIKNTGFSQTSPALRAIEASARRGNPYGQSFFARLLLDGVGMDSDDREAEEWFRRAASKGEASAIFHLGEMMAQGRVIETSEEELSGWFFELGKFFLGKGDLVKALDCLVSIKKIDPRHFLAQRLEEEIEEANRSRMNPG